VLSMRLTACSRFCTDAMHIVIQFDAGPGIVPRKTHAL